jgi:hypothetical protein
MRSRIVALSATLVLGAALAIPATTSVAYAESFEAAGDLSLEECKIRAAAGVGSFNEGFERDLRAAPPTGILTVQVVFVEFPDLALGAPENASLEQVHDGITAAVEHLETLSGSRLEVSVLEHEDPVMMPKPIADYPAGELSAWSNATWMTFVVDAVMAAPASIDFAASDVVWVFFPWAAPLPTRAAADNTIYVPEGGPPADRAVTLPMAAGGATGGLLAHETGHTFGLPDLYDTAKPEGTAKFVGNWDLMGMSDALGGELFGWHLWRLGWIDDTQVSCLAPGGGGGRNLTLSALTRHGPSVIAVIPTAEHRALVIESRRADRYDEHIPKIGVVVYVLSTDVPTGSGPVNVVTTDGTESPVYLADFQLAPLQTGDQYTDTSSGTRITVVASDAGSDTVRIAPADAPTPPPIDPVTPSDPGAKPPSAATAILPPTGQDPTGAVALSAGLLTVGLFAVTLVYRRRRDRRMRRR